MDINIVLVAPEIPQNTGSTGRLCVCLDARLHLIKPLGFVLDEVHLRRAGLDYWQYVQLTVHDSWEAFLATEQPRRMRFSSTRGKQSLYDCRFTAGDYLVFGNETSGLPPAFYSEHQEQLFNIPMPGKNSRSHNLATSVGIVVYEAYRQICAGTGP